jgi:chemotaxis protein methyltransferase CheR
VDDTSIEGDEPLSKYRSDQLFVGGDINDEDFAEIRDILFEGRGFDLDGYKDRCIKRRIAARVRNLGYPRIEGYIALLANDDEEQERLLEALTIHVSQFFRNPTTFSVLEEKLLPELLRKRRGEGEVRVWSVGCAAGEEPYSIALLCDEMCGPHDQVSILGTDVSADVLKKARAGLYETHRLVEVPDPVLAEYFIKEGVRYRLNGRIRSKVRFLRHDILQDRPFPRADLILCRNMLIYFSRQEQEKILKILVNALAPEGLLVLGRAETMVSESRELFTCVDPAERIYRKRD